MRKMKRSDIPVLIIAGVILIGVLAGIVTMISGALEKKKLEPSADYYGLTVLEAMYWECEARGLSITDEELAALEAQALENQRHHRGHRLPDFPWSEPASGPMGRKTGGKSLDSAAAVCS